MNSYQGTWDCPFKYDYDHHEMLVFLKYFRIFFLDKCDLNSHFNYI